MKLNNNNKITSTNSYYLDYLNKANSFPRNLYHREKHNYVQKLVNSISTNSVIVDAGCGNGSITAKYLGLHRIIGIDEQKEAIDYCRKNFNGNYIQSRLDNLPIKNNSVDLVLMLDTIEHLASPKMILKELYRIMKRNSKILICTINYGNPLWILLENTWHRIAGGNCRTFSREVHPTRYTANMLDKHCSMFFRCLSLEKKVFGMELFYLGFKS